MVFVVLRSGFRMLKTPKIGALLDPLELISSPRSRDAGRAGARPGPDRRSSRFIVVAIFLIAVHRVLGLIAVGALIVYGLTSSR